mgnify:CR=1 FL=1
MAKKKKKVEEAVEPQVEETPAVEETLDSSTEADAKELKEEAPKAACPDCTFLAADGGKSEFGVKGGVKAGLINPNTLCPNCEGHGVV